MGSSYQGSPGAYSGLLQKTEEIPRTLSWLLIGCFSSLQQIRGLATVDHFLSSRTTPGPLEPFTTLPFLVLPVIPNNLMYLTQHFISVFNNLSLIHLKYLVIQAGYNWHSCWKIVRITYFSPPLIGWPGPLVSTLAMICAQEAIIAFLQVSNTSKRIWMAILLSCPWLQGSVTQISWLYLDNSARGQWPPVCGMSVKCEKCVLFPPHIISYENRAPPASPLGSCHPTRPGFGCQIYLWGTSLKGSTFILWSFADQVSSSLV